MSHERSIWRVPRFTWFCLLSALGLQIFWHLHNPIQESKRENLPAPPSLSSLRLASFGEPIALAKLNTLYLQTFDQQTEQRSSLHQLNYDHLQSWLERILLLDSSAQYPLFLASQVYTEIDDEAKQRLMLNFIYQQFLLDPDHRWKSLAHAAILARHRLKDMPLAQHYARALRLYAKGKNVPSWATQMEIFLLEDMNELEHARILLGGLLKSGQIKDPYEFHFLEQRLIALEDKITKQK